mgnify:CR=1 FL=1
MNNYLLFEVGVEELPSRFVSSTLDQIKSNLTKMFNENRIEFSDIKTYGTPRRLTFIVENISERQSNLEEEVKGPSKKIALDADGKAVWAYVDVSQNPNGKDESKSKKELQSDYGMKSTSAQIGNIEGGAEWYEQAATFEKYVVGKTADEVAATETEKRDEEHTSVPKSGSDLAAGCTMDIGAFLEAVAEAFANAQ